MCPLRMGGIEEELSAMLHSHVSGTMAGVVPAAGLSGTDKIVQLHQQHQQQLQQQQQQQQHQQQQQSLFMTSAPYTVVPLQQGFSSGLATGLNSVASARPLEMSLGHSGAGPMQHRWEGFSNKKWLPDAGNVSEVVDVNRTSQCIPGVVMQSGENPHSLAPGSGSGSGSGSPHRANLSRFNSAPSALLAEMIDDIREQDLDSLSELMAQGKRCDGSTLGTVSESGDDGDLDKAGKGGLRIDEAAAAAAAAGMKAFNGDLKYDISMAQRYGIPLPVQGMWPPSSGQGSPGSAGSNQQVRDDFMAEAGKSGSGSMSEASEAPMKRGSLLRHGSCPADFLDKLAIEEQDQMDGIQRPFMMDAMARSPVKNVLPLDVTGARDSMSMFGRDEVMRDVLSPTDSAKTPWSAADLEKSWFSDPSRLRGQGLDPQAGNPQPLTRFASLPSPLKPRSPQQYGESSIPCRTRAKRGCATHPRSIAERNRRTRIGERMKRLQELLPNLDKQSNTADMLDEAVEYINLLKRRVEELEAKVQDS